ncbi:MAG: hypothetical protein KGN02_01130 [bacterium]|nr:hypothetical protein [bacterium]
MTMRLSILALLITCWCAFAAGPALADPVPQNVYRSLEAGKPARNAGQMNGRIVAVDYAGGTLVVQTNRGEMHVAVVPNTAIYRGNDYATLGDLRAGQNVHLAVYEVGGRLVAQLIRVRP